MKKGLRITGWVFFALFLLLFFTVLKFPQDRIKPLVLAQINQILAPQGLSLSAEQGSLGLFLGLSYTLENITLTGAELTAPIQIERVKVSPTLFSLMAGKLDAAITLRHQEGQLWLQIAMPTPEQNAEMTLSLEANQFPLGASQLTRLWGISVGGTVDGTLELAGNAQIPSSLSGSAALKIQKLQLDQQSILGFSLPQITGSLAHVRLQATKGKLAIEQLQIEKGGDLWLNITGSTTLAQNWETSQLDLKTTFGFSEKLTQTLSFLDAFLGAAKQADGSYAYTVTGSFAAPFPNPIFAK